MSRTPDGSLRERLLDVALTLLRVQGENGVTMRSVAESAGTTTPTVYNRFRSKDELLLALALRERDRYVERQARRKSLEDAVVGYLDWAVGHPHEYALIYGPKWSLVLSAESGRPGLRWTDEQLAKRHGGEPEQYVGVTSALWLLLHGAAQLLTQQSKGPSAAFVRRHAIAACERIIKNAKNLRA